MSSRTMALQSACCSGLDAIGHAANLVATGQADIAICGGTEAPLFFHPMYELKMAGLAPGNAERPEDQCRPFDRWRTTGVIGEGSCVVVLEPEESKRSAYAWIRGYAYAMDRRNQLCSGLVDAIRVAVAGAKLRPSQIECISAWGPGHREIDRCEAACLHDVFGPAIDNVPVVSLKGAIGNPLGAAGAIQVAAAALGLRNGLVPPTVNFKFPDADCKLSISSESRFLSHQTALINSHGVSGTNACLVLER
jgi:3-oxoacyl-(acyl-carrier-protein) synthase